jgi:hypothetical protein
VYNTDEFNDFKRSWVITETNLIRDVFNRFNNQRYILSNKAVPSPGQRDTLLKEIYDGQTVLLVTQRMFDDELESLTFISPTTKIDTLKDWVFLRSVLEKPNDTYSLIKSKQYPHVDITKEGFNDDPRFSFDIYLHFLDPQIMLWHTTSSWVKTRSELYFFGRLGNDYLNTPFWFKGTLAYGLRYSFVENVRRIRRNIERFAILVGVETPINFSIRHEDANSRTSIFKNRKLEASGVDAFIGARYAFDDVGPFVGDTPQRVELALDASLAVSEKLVYPVNIPDTFYSIRNSVTLAATARHLGNFYFGLGVSVFDLYHYDKKTFSPQRLALLGPKENHVLPFVKVGVAEDGSLLGYDVGAMYNYDLKGKYAFLCISTSFTLSNTFGVDLRYFKSLSTKNLPPWHDDNYIAFSPIIRINY